MTIREIEEQIHSAAWLGRTPGLARMTELLHRLDNPQNKLQFVHIAGTNGKGSTAAMTASILTAAGHRTALFTSPHLTHLGERFLIDGVEMTTEELEQVAHQVLAVAEDIQPTEFELMTAMGLIHFAQQHCDIVVLEVGLGGRLDSTNVIPPPLVAAITNIGLEHTQLLGDTLTAIAAEKAGILKGGSRCVLYHQSTDVMEVVKSVCGERDIPLTVTQPQLLQLLECGVEGQTFRYRDETYFTPLLGRHQLENAMVVLEMVEVLRRGGWKIPQQAVADGLRTTRWAGRMEVLSHSPDFIVDGGHNVQCLSALMEGITALYPQKKFIFLMGILADKNVDEMLSLVLPHAKGVVTITPDSPRAMTAQDLADRICAEGVEAVSTTSVVQGILTTQLRAEDSDVIVAFGSLYIVGEIRSYFLGDGE